MASALLKALAFLAAVAMLDAFVTVRKSSENADTNAAIVKREATGPSQVSPTGADQKKYKMGIGIPIAIPFGGYGMGGYGGYGMGGYGGYGMGGYGSYPGYPGYGAPPPPPPVAPVYGASAPVYGGYGAPMYGGGAGYARPPYGQIGYGGVAYLSGQSGSNRN